MRFLDWLAPKSAKQQQSVAETSQPQKAETASEMYARQAAEDKATRKPVDKVLPSAILAKARDIGRRIEGDGKPIQPDAPLRTAPASDASSPEAMRQAMAGQDKAAAELSPTTAQVGKTALEKESPAPTKEPSPKAPVKGNPRPPTLPRRPPSWER